MTAVAQKYMKLLGLKVEYVPSETVVIRGRKYCFPSFTDMFRASRGKLSEYEVR
jgi:hypothetical protein